MTNFEGPTFLGLESILLSNSLPKQQGLQSLILNTLQLSQKFNTAYKNMNEWMNESAVI